MSSRRLAPASIYSSDDDDDDDDDDITSMELLVNKGKRNANGRLAV
jgi:hypothetical protein